MICLFASVTDLLKNKAIFLLFIFWLETSSYKDRRSITLLHSMELALQKIRLSDEHHKAFKDPLHVPVGPITKARSKKIKEALNGLIQEIWADSNIGRSKLGPKEDEGVINLIQAIEG